MMRRFITTLTATAAIALTIPAAASAGDQRPLNGHLDLDFVGVPCEVAPEAPFLTWIGTAEIDGTTYGWADFPTSPVVEDGKFIYAAEYWAIFHLGEGEAVTPENACDTDRVLIAGDNEAWGPPGMTAKADGYVTEVDPDGPFAGFETGDRMFWRGRVTDDAVTQFVATLHIQPTR